MEDAEGYEILTGDKISRLRQEVDRFKGNEKSSNPQNLTQAVKELNESIKKLYQLFADVQEEIVKEYTSGESPEKKMDKVIEQNKQIAEAVLTISEKLGEVTDKDKEEKNQIMPEKPIFEPITNSVVEEKKSWFPFGKTKPEEVRQPQMPQEQQRQQESQFLQMQQQRQEQPQQPAFKDEDFQFNTQEFQQPKYSPQQQPQQTQWGQPQQSYSIREEERWGDDNEVPPPPAPGMGAPQKYYPPNISRSRPMPDPIRMQPQYGYRQPMQQQRTGYVNPNFPTQDNFQGIRGVTPTLERPIHAEPEFERRRGLLGVFKK